MSDRILRAAWMSIAVAIAIEIALVAAAMTWGRSDDMRPFLADLAGKVSWSMIVCVGISAGTFATGARAPAMGWLGFLSAPAGFAVAKAAHKSVAQGLDVAVSAATGPNAWQMMIIRALEYGLLGLAVGQLAGRPWARLPAYAAVGLAIGAATAAIVLAATLRSSPTPPPTLALVSKGINEVLFPLGCAIVLYAANALGQRMRIAVAA